MIGGYIYQQQNKELAEKLNAELGNSFKRMFCAEKGFLFYDNPFHDFQTTTYATDRFFLLSQDLLVSRKAGGEYRQTEIQREIADQFTRSKGDILNAIVSDYRLIVIDNTAAETMLYLVSNRAGSGRMYYSVLETGILFSSDIRFLLKILPFQINDAAIYAILKYGAIPEPLTISENIAAVPGAHYLYYNINNGQKSTVSYFQFEFPCDQHLQQGSADAFIQPARERLLESARLLSKFRPAILLSGGIDSSLYASYLNKVSVERFAGINCIFGDDDPEFAYTKTLADKIKVNFHVGKMGEQDTLTILNEAVALSGYPFSDFSLLPIVFILKFIKDHVKDAHLLIEGNGGDDCFGFPDLATQSKLRFKSKFPGVFKELIASLFSKSGSWKIESQNRFLARILALADVHEINPLNYFLTLTPVNFLGLNIYKAWDQQVNKVMEDVFCSCVNNVEPLSYQSNTTVRQLMHVNSRRWAAKAYAVGENLGIRIIYPYIWRDILIEQGKIPWDVKINNGVIKWPLKRLLEEFMPKDFIYRKKSGFIPPFKIWLTSKSFNGQVREILLASASNITRIVSPRIIDDLLRNALQGKNLRHAILNFLWGGLFTEMWIKKQR